MSHTNREDNASAARVEIRGWRVILVESFWLGNFTTPTERTALRRGFGRPDNHAGLEATFLTVFLHRNFPGFQ